MEGRVLTKEEWATFKRWIARKDYGALRKFFEDTPLNTRCHELKMSVVTYVSSIFVEDPRAFEIVVSRALKEGCVFHIRRMFDGHLTQHLEVLMNEGVVMDPVMMTRTSACVCLPSECKCVQFKEHFILRNRSLHAIFWCFAHTAPAFVDVFHECFGEIFNKTTLMSWDRRRVTSTKKKVKR